MDGLETYLLILVLGSAAITVGALTAIHFEDTKGKRDGSETNREDFE